MTLPTTSHNWHRRTVRPRVDSGGVFVFLAAGRPGRRRVFYELVYDKGQLASGRYDDLVAEFASKRGENAEFSWTPPDTGVAVNVKIVREDDLDIKTPQLYAAETVLTLEVFA